jgi:hypothetical protein
MRGFAGRRITATGVIRDSWPGSCNPHLLVSQQTAADARPVGPTVIWSVFEPLDVHPARLRAEPHPG